MPGPMKSPTSAPDPTNITRRADELRSLLKGADPFWLSARTGCGYSIINQEEGVFDAKFWGQPISFTYPAFIARDPKTAIELSPFHQAMLLYYFNTADGTPLTGRWISFADLPDGRFYNQAFQGYTGAELQRYFKNDIDSLKQAALANAGIYLPDSPGNLAFRFQALPRIPMLLVIWEGDEDFPASYQVLFDEATAHYLPTDACAILGSTLTGRLRKRIAAS
jgi:hypothetical protein